MLAFKVIYAFEVIYGRILFIEKEASHHFIDLIVDVG